MEVVAVGRLGGRLERPLVTGAIHDARVASQCLGGKSLTAAAVMARMPVAMLGPGSG